MFLTKLPAVFRICVKKCNPQILKIILGSWAFHIETANWPAKTSELSDNTNWTMLKDGICTTDKVFPTFAEVNEWAASDLTMIQGKKSCRLKKRSLNEVAFFYLFQRRDGEIWQVQKWLQNSAIGNHFHHISVWCHRVCSRMWYSKVKAVPKL